MAQRSHWEITDFGLAVRWPDIDEDIGLGGLLGVPLEALGRIAHHEDRRGEIRGFRLSLSRDLGLNRQAGRGSFIDSVLSNVKTFYADRRDPASSRSVWPTSCGEACKL